MVMKRIPYVYKITRRDNKEFYFGCKYGVSANPETFWKDYFTSSSKVHQIINYLGKSIFIPEIVKTFDSPKEALMYEEKMIKETIHDAKSLNCAYGFHTPITNKYRKLTDPATGESSYSLAGKKAKMTKLKTIVNGKNIYQLAGEKLSITLANDDILCKKRVASRDYFKKDNRGLTIGDKISLANKGKSKTEETKDKLSKSVKSWIESNPEKIKRQTKSMIAAKNRVKTNGLTSNQEHSIFMLNHNPTKNTIWINNGSINKRVLKTKDFKLDDNWHLGRISFKINRVERTCPYCGLVGRGPNMTRYHFENCKYKDK